MSSEMCSGVSFCGAPAGAHPGHIQGARPEKDPRAAGVLRGRVRRTIPRHPRSAAGVRRTSLARVVVSTSTKFKLCVWVSRVRCEHEDALHFALPHTRQRPWFHRFYLD